MAQPDYLTDGLPLVLSKREHELIRQWRENANGVAVIVDRDVARHVERLLEYRKQARRNLISPLYIGNFLTLAIGTTNEG